MKIILLDGGHPSASIGEIEAYNHKKAACAIALMGTFSSLRAKNTVVVFDGNSAGAETFARILGNEFDWAYYKSDGSIHGTIEGILNLDLSRRDIIFIHSFASMQVRNLIRFFKVVLNEWHIPEPKPPIYTPSYDFYVIDTEKVNLLFYKI